MYCHVLFLLEHHKRRHHWYKQHKCHTSDGEVDEAYRVKNDELVEFPYGYHTTVSTPGYQTYFLWLMAGDYQGFNRSNDPEHEWVLN